MIIEIPQYLNDSERLEYIKILHKIENKINSTSDWYRGYTTALKHIEMFLSGAIKRIDFGNENK